jgi:hypothetical protein
MSVYSSQSEPGEQICFDPRYNKEYRSYHFRTETSSIFYPYAELFLDSTIKAGKIIKIVPLCIYELLTPQALAY